MSLKRKCPKPLLGLCQHHISDVAEIQVNLAGRELPSEEFMCPRDEEPVGEAHHKLVCTGKMFVVFLCRCVVEN